MSADDSVRATGPLHTLVQQGTPPIAWDYKEGKFRLVLNGVALKKTGDPQEGVRLFFQPPVLYDTRIRPVGCASWGPGLILPVDAVGLSNLEPDTEYECMVIEVDSQGTQIPGSQVHKKIFRSPRSLRAAK